MPSVTPEDPSQATQVSDNEITEYKKQLDREVAKLLQGPPEDFIQSLPSATHDTLKGFQQSPYTDLHDKVTGSKIKAQIAYHVRTQRWQHWGTSQERKEAPSRVVALVSDLEAK